MKRIEPITEEDLMHLSAKTEIRLEDFVKSPKLDMQELASLSRQILKELNRPRNMAKELILMQALEKLRKQEQPNPV